MISLLIGIAARIFSNSFLNLFQKVLTSAGEKPSAVNFYTYLGLTVIGVFICNYKVFSPELFISILIMGLLGAAGNYFIIKALSIGELSELAPINSYKPIVALILGIFLLGELPGIKELCGILFIIIGTFVLFNNKMSGSKAVLYRFLALIFSGTEAIFIKKVILLSDINSAFFFWAVSGLLFAFIPIINKSIKIKRTNVKYQVILVLMVLIMQYSTNYLFSIMNVSYALALFQLSTIVSVFLGVNVFNEKGLVRKLTAALIMISGALLIMLN